MGQMPWEDKKAQDKNERRVRFFKHSKNDVCCGNMLCPISPKQKEEKSGDSEDPEG